MAKETIIRKEPAISVIPLSRYITADGNKKERILLKAKFQDTFMVARYSSPKSAINNFLKDAERNISIFDDFIQKEKRRLLDSDFKVIDQRCSLEALKILKLNSSKLFIPYNNHFSKKNLKSQNTHVFSEGVDVSLSPDFAIYDRVTNKIAGFVKLNFSKKTTERLTYQQGQLIAGLIKDHLEEQFETKFDRKLCIAIDVFSAKVIYAPEEITWKKDKPKLKVAYKEIYNVWPYLHKN